MKSATSSIFTTTDPRFCKLCGSVLPLPTADKRTVECRKCSSVVDIAEFHGITTTRTIIFNKVQETASTGKHQTDGPSIDRECSKCGHPTMTYKTQQTRSADEGQTVFFTCADPKCRNQEIEYS
ncbi:ZNRD1 [Bugula neritina]|uniref:DNA-directed RNA polymerase subunit n=1 Tax=Bugula neritina TaxID=10212 RepID=A0A7J7K5H0_BUGNE|nr:ZNRD1 [Bugula neritina]KAF6035293.1 ZNRD1 [Bugula neritina]